MKRKDGQGSDGKAPRRRGARGVRGVWGDRTGGVMMEYVILGLLVAAAVVVAVAMFGKTVVGMFDVNAKALTGDHTGARNTLKTTRESQNQDSDEAEVYHNSMHL